MRDCDACVVVVEEFSDAKVADAATAAFVQARGGFGEGGVSICTGDSPRFLIGAHGAQSAQHAVKPECESNKNPSGRGDL